MSVITAKKKAIVLLRDGGLCVSGGCERKVFARSLCRRHWQAWRDSTAAACRLDGCDTPARAQGLCNLHWLRNYTKGSFDAPVRKTVLERFWEKVLKTDSCWLWQGAISDTGYGAFNAGDRNVSAHRFTYELEHGKQPSDRHLDHLCRVRACCNPEHLDLVSPKENQHRGEAGPKSLCSRGHSMDDAYIRPDIGTRMCRTCNELRARKRRGVTKEEV